MIEFRDNYILKNCIPHIRKNQDANKISLPLSVTAIIHSPTSTITHNPETPDRLTVSQSQAKRPVLRFPPSSRRPIFPTNPSTPANFDPEKKSYLTRRTNPRLFQAEKRHYREGGRKISTSLFAS